MTWHLDIGASFATPSEVFVRTQLGVFSKITDAWICMPDPAGGINPPNVWVNFYKSAPTVAPTPTLIQNGGAPFSRDVYCEVAAYAGTFPDYNVQFDLWSSDETMQAGAVDVANGTNFYTYSLSSVWQGETVKFRARYGNSGQYGPWSAWSGNYTVGS